MEKQAGYRVGESEAVIVKRPYKRRRILIGAFQYRLLMANLAYFGTIVLVFAVVVFLPLVLQIRSSSTFSPVKAEGLADEFLFFHARLWPALFIVLVLLAFHSVLISHRIAGPLYRFRSVLRAVAEGDLTVRVRIRPTDYLTEEADLLNEMIGALRQRIGGLEEQSIALRAAFSELKTTLDGRSGEGLDETLDELDMGMEYLETCLGQFRVVTRAKDSGSPCSVSGVAHGATKKE